MWLRKASIVAVAVLLAGCAWHVPKASQYGPPPPNAEPAALAYFSRVLPNASKSQYLVGNPYRAYRLGTLLDDYGHVVWRGWAVDVDVHPRGKDGDFANWQTYHLQFAGGAIVDAYEADGNDTLWRRIDPEEKPNDGLD